MRWFWLIWITITTAAVMWVALAVRPAAAPQNQKTTITINLMPAWRLIRTPAAVAALTLLVIFLGVYVAMTLVWEDFAYYDNSMFTLGTLRGHNIPLLIWRDEGRFMPLALQEFNLIRHFTNTNIGYHVLLIAQLLMFFCILLMLDAELSLTARVVLGIFVLLTPSILTSFNGLIFPERDVLFFLVCLLLSVKQFELTRSIAWAIAAVISAQIMIYYKETAFLLLLGFALARIILRCRNGRHGAWDYDRLWGREGLLDLCLGCLAILFLLYYLAEVRLHLVDASHSGHYRESLGELILNYIRIDILAWLFVAIVLGRAYLVLRRRVAPDLLWDGLALGGTACFVAYLALRIFSIYYMAPVDFIAMLYLGRLLVLSLAKLSSWGKMAAMLMTLVVLAQGVLVSAYTVFERKNIIRGKVEIASLVQGQFQRSSGNVLRLFFPFANPYVIMEFASYLSYRGVSIEGATDGARGPNNVVLAASTATEDGLCVAWLKIRCHVVKGPSPGDLVIVLPDDEPSLAKAWEYRNGGELLLLYEPYPRLSQWLSSLFDQLHIRALRHGSGTMPGSWLYGSVTLWK
jgi:hypothetical protein